MKKRRNTKFPGRKGSLKHFHEFMLKKEKEKNVMLKRKDIYIYVTSFIF